MDKVIAISGGFDPIHEGHINYIQEAAKLGRLQVYLNTDEWLMRKKGFVFLPFKQRAAIIMAIKGVELVIPAMDEDGSVCANLTTFKPDIFCNGGDRFEDNIPEKALCKNLGIEMRFNIGGEKIESSSELVRRVNELKT